ncbi:MAG: type II secretion system minor pseudopilin GspK [Pseudomonadota bacterium]|nr:type II secretion system minor pseudopilin GspK [Pseudomonadota bacterium]
MRRKQRGVALIIALVLVALAAILATKLTFDGWLERRRTIGVLAAEQAVHFGMGAEALAADALTQQTGQSDTLAQSWAQPQQPMPLTPENDPEGEPIGALQGSLEDMQGRFNLNNLGRVLQPTATSQQSSTQQSSTQSSTSTQTSTGGPDPQPLEQFQRLLVSVGLETKWAGIARDWITATDVPSSPDGAKDAVYTAQSPPYRTGNYPMMSPSELMNMPGFGIDRYRKIAPYVTALPTATAAINICTASGPVLDSLLPESLSNEYSGNPDLLVAERKKGCFPETAAFTNILNSVPGTAAKLSGRFAEKTAYFRLTTRVSLGTSEFTLYSLLYRSQGGKVTPLLRTFGTP